MGDRGLSRGWAALCALALAGCGEDAPEDPGGETSSTTRGGPIAGPTTGAGVDTSGDGSTAAAAPASSSTGEVATSTGDDTTGAAVPPADPVLAFTEVAAEVGLDYDHGEFSTTGDCLVDAVFLPGGYCISERMSAAVAVADYDEDGDPDVYVSRIHGGDLLLDNAGDGTFAAATERGLDFGGGSSGSAWGDFDNDGDQDLYVTTIGGTQHRLYINDGTGHFTEEAVARGAAIKSLYPHSPFAIALGDYDLDGWLDLYVSEWKSDTGLGKHPSHNRLLHNLGAAAPGHFEDVTEAAGVVLDDVWAEVGAQRGAWGFSPAFADLDGDRWPDLVVTSDFDCSRLFFNAGDGTFVDATSPAGVGLDDNGMGSTFGDYDLDGDLDWFVTSITGPGDPPGNRLYRNEGDRTFTEVGVPLGLGGGGWGWGATFFDPDNDGDLDLAMASGYYYTSYLADPNLLWRNEGDGTFSPNLAFEVGFDVIAQARGLVAFDYDLDGDEDVLVANNAEPPSLLRNDTRDAGDHLRIRVIGSASNRDGIGARLAVTTTAGGPTQVREIGSASHYLGQQPKTAHFGVGPGTAPVAEVRVYWPASDQVQVLTEIERNTLLVVEEP